MKIITTGATIELKPSCERDFLGNIMTKSIVGTVTLNIVSCGNPKGLAKITKKGKLKADKLQDALFKHFITQEIIF